MVGFRNVYSGSGNPGEYAVLPAETPRVHKRTCSSSNSSDNVITSAISDPNFDPTLNLFNNFNNIVDPAINLPQQPQQLMGDAGDVNVNGVGHRVPKQQGPTDVQAPLGLSSYQPYVPFQDLGGSSQASNGFRFDPVLSHIESLNQPYNGYGSY